MSPILDQQELIIRDSIIENKERTKNYWEQLMMAAEAQANGKLRLWDASETAISTSGINRNLKNSYSLLINSYQNNMKNEESLENCEGDSLKNNVKAEVPLNSLSMEDRIALELQNQKEREDELKQLRKQLFLVSSRKEISPSKDLGSGNEELSSIHTNDDSTFSEYGSEEKEHSLDGNSSRVNTPHSEDFIHGRAQSLESVSSGHSSGSGSHLNENRDSPKRKILVRPYEDPHEEEEVPIYKRTENETPIERDIRMAKEREEELRKEKGLINENEKFEPLKIQRVSSKKDAIKNDTRDVQHRIATNRIQQEIEEASERENELRTEGKILTTSEERVDAKVTRFTQLAEYAILENRHSKDSKLKHSSPVNNLSVSKSKMKEKTITTAGNIGQNTNTYIKSSTTQLNKRYAANSTQKGVMQRFIATKGQLSLPIINANVGLEIQTPVILNNSPLVRKGYISAEEKIQEELREMEDREEELRLQRAHNQISRSAFRHRSQPNLMNISDEEEESEVHSWSNHKTLFKSVSRLNHSVSNPNLLDDSLEKVNVRMPNKRFSLLQQWENRIQNAQ